MTIVTIKPADGRRVPMPPGYGLPRGALLPEDGFAVTLDPFTRRLLADGDVVVVEPPPPPPTPGASARSAPAAPQASASPAANPGANKESAS